MEKCGFCHTGEETVSICGRFFSRKGVAAHRKCMQYSASLSQYTRTTFGGFQLQGVRKEIKRGASLKCHLCKSGKGVAGGATGATAGCSWAACSRTFHFPCARQAAETRRMVTTDRQGNEYVLYRVFCKDDHVKSFRDKCCQKLDVVCTEDSDENWDPESDSDNNMTDQKSQTRVAELNKGKTPSPASNESAKSDTEFSQSEDAKDKSDAEGKSPRRGRPRKKKPRPTKKEKEESYFEVGDSSDEEAITFRITPSGSPTNEKNCATPTKQIGRSPSAGCNAQKNTGCPAASTKIPPPADMENLSSPKSGKRSQGNTPKRPSAADSGFQPPKGRKIATSDEDTSLSRKLRLRSNSGQNASPVKRPTVAKNNLPVRRSRRFSCSLAESGSDSQSGASLSPRKGRKRKHEDTNSSEDSKHFPRTSRENCQQKTPNVNENTVVPSTSEPETKFTKEEDGVQTSLFLEGEDHSEAFVICILEDKFGVKAESLQITRMIQRQFLVPEHRMTRWKYGGSEEPNRCQMLCYMRDVTRALLNEDQSEVYRLLFDLTADDLERYQNHIDFNIGLVDVDSVLEVKLRENIVTNLTVAQQKSGKRLGCVMNLDDEVIMLVLLVGDYLDDDYKIRTKLGHSFSTHPWGSTTFARDLSQFTPDVVQYFNSLELQNLCELLEYRMKGAPFELFVKPSDALLQLKNTNRVSERLRYFLKLKRKKMFTDVKPRISALFIGPLDTVCIDTSAYCQKCVPLFVEENLTALNEVFVVVDLSLGCSIHTVDDFFRQEKLPVGAEAQVWSAFNPAIVPVTCVVMHFKMK